MRPEIRARVGPCQQVVMQRVRWAATGAARPSGEAHVDLDIADALAELGAVLGAHLIRPRVERLAGRRVRTGTEEVRLHDGGELRRGAHALKHLLAVVPSHATLGNAAAHLQGAVQIVRRGTGD